MQDPNIENTVPIRPNQPIEETVPTVVNHSPVEPQLDLEQTQPGMPVPDQKRPRRWPWIILGIVLILAFGAIGTWQGYQAAVKIREDHLKEQYTEIATKHFMAGLVAQQNKQYDIARTQYEYVIEIDPSFPGVQDKLREVMVASAVINTPTPIPTEVMPTLTPTLDTRPQQDIYAAAKQEYTSQNWEGVFAAVDSLRRIDPSYQAVQIDGMLYFAFRFRGIDKIIHQANLEGGLYDLALAERFAPLDVDALGYRNWARMYLNGASFWQIDWEKVMAYFEEIYPYFPNMRDSSGLTAIERYRIAAKGQGDKLYNAGDYCGALDYYGLSLQAVPDAALEQTATAVYGQCYVPTAIPTETPTLTVTPTGQQIPVQTVSPPAETAGAPTVQVTAAPSETQTSNP